MPTEAVHKATKGAGRTGATQSALAPFTILATYAASRALVGYDAELASQPDMLATLAGAFAAVVQGALTVVANVLRNVLGATKWGKIILGSGDALTPPK